MPNPSFDPKCYDLAELFLGDTSMAGNPEIIAALAAEIQQTIEDFIADADLGEDNE
jgi:hypothetical protein